jgi:hypothetical protein
MARFNAVGIGAESAARFFLSDKAIQQAAVLRLLPDVRVFLRDLDESRTISYTSADDRATWMQFMDRRASRLMAMLGTTPSHA